MIAGSKKHDKGKKPSSKYLWVAVFVLPLSFAIFGILLYSVWTESVKDDEPQSPASEKSSFIAEVASPDLKDVEQENSSVKVESVNDWQPPKDAYQDERGIWRQPGGHRVYDPTRIGEKTNLHMVGDKPSIFRHRSEREIERLLTIEPGQPMFGMRRYDARFEEDFLKSMEEPIVISADDSDEVRAAKQLMIDTKIEIMDRIRNGEKLGDILKETRDELQRLAQYKRNLRKELLSLAKDGHAEEEDLDDFIKAANQMLEANGIDPLKNTGLLKRNLKYQTQRSIQ